jgi:acyl carrier protein
MKITLESLLQDISEILEENKINKKSNFKRFKNWDSLSILSIIMLTQSKYKVNLSNEEITKSNNTEGLYKIIEKKIKK